MEKQVNKEHYTFARYCYPERWASYYYQLREIIGSDPHSVLEVGAGDEVVKNYISRQFGISYTTVDIAEDLKPDVIGSIEHLPFADNSFDTVCAFEVLEHIPFDTFEKCIKELCRVSKKYVLISVPHFGPSVRIELKLPLFPRIRFAMKVPVPLKHVFNGQHYWEIGKKGYSVRSIRGVISRQCKIEKEFVPFENQYHHFFVLKK